MDNFTTFSVIVFSNHYYLESVTQTRRDYKRILQLKQVLDFIEHNYRQSADSEAAFCLCDTCLPSTFCRFFSEMTHQTPMDYLNHAADRTEHVTRFPPPMIPLRRLPTGTALMISVILSVPSRSTRALPPGNTKKRKGGCPYAFDLLFPSQNVA